MSLTTQQNLGHSRVSAKVTAAADAEFMFCAPVFALSNAWRRGKTCHASHIFVATEEGISQLPRKILLVVAVPEAFGVDRYSVGCSVERNRREMTTCLVASFSDVRPSQHADLVARMKEAFYCS